MTRIVAGKAGGRRLHTPRGRATRPTSEKVRAALFDALEVRGAVRGAAVLDLYAGSGALGLEAASRGAARVTLVESDRRAASVIRGNAESLGLGRVTVLGASVPNVLAGTEHAAYDLVLIDPPYGLAEESLTGVLAGLVERGWLAEDADVVVERSGRSPEPTWPAGLVRVRGKRYGETAVWFAKTG